MNWIPFNWNWTDCFPVSFPQTRSLRNCSIESMRGRSHEKPAHYLLALYTYHQPFSCTLSWLEIKNNKNKSKKEKQQQQSPWEVNLFREMKEKASFYLQVSEMTFLFYEEEMGKLSYLAYEWSYKRPRFDPSVYANVYLHMQMPLTKKGKQRHTFHSKRSSTKIRSLLFIEVRSHIIGSRQHHSRLFLRGKKLVDHTKGTGLILSFDCTILLSIDTYQTVSSSFAASACSSSRMMGYETTESLLPFHWKMSVPQSAGSYSSYPFPPSQVRIPD